MSSTSSNKHDEQNDLFIQAHSAFLKDPEHFATNLCSISVDVKAQTRVVENDHVVHSGGKDLIMILDVSGRYRTKTFILFIIRSQETKSNNFIILIMIYLNLILKMQSKLLIFENKFFSIK